MIYRVEKPYEGIYNNTLLRHHFTIADNFSFYIPIKETFNINFIDIYLYKPDNCSGKLAINVFLNNKTTFFKFDISQISNESAVRLIFDNHQEISQPIGIQISVDHEGDPVSIWKNHIGPCAYVCGNICREYVLKYRPKISIITPLYKTDIFYLEKTVESVIDQAYDNWELCLVDDGSKKEKLSKYLKSLQDDRIKIKINKKNKGIVSASNEALEMATGMYAAFLDHDDLLATDALIEIASVLNANKKIDFIYTDEDKVLSDGSLVAAFYKPDFNYDMLLSHMYTCHLSVYRMSILRKLKFLREGFDGSQDYDLALRMVEKTKNIYHIPKVLYHWRVSEDSTSKSILNKPSARINAIRAIDDHLKRSEIRASVEAGPFQGHYHVNYIEGSNTPHVGVIIPTKDNYICLKALFDSLVISSTPHWECDFLIVDNGSTDRKMLSLLKGLSTFDKLVNINVEVMRYTKKFNFSEINNQAAERFKNHNILLFLNDDIEVMDHSWIKMMRQHFARNDVAAVGPKLLYLDHRIQHAGIFVGINGVAGHSHKYLNDWEPGYFSRPHVVQEVTAVTGACMMIRTEDFFSVGGFEEDLPKAFNDIDLCLKLRQKGRKIIYTPYARLYHKESVSRGKDSLNDAEFQKAIEYMEKKWNLRKFKDPFYNPNLPSNCEKRSWI